MKVNLRFINKAGGSASLKRVAEGLSTKLGYKVIRTSKAMPHRLQFVYGGVVDKISQYEYFSTNTIPSLEWTTDALTVTGWLGDGATVFGRKLLTSSCGKGIVIMEPTDPFTPCPVYTKYAKKKREFRVHCFKGTVVAIVEKKRKTGWEGVRESKIRNLVNGYVFVQEVSNIPEGLEDLALKASKVSTSDFTGVDIGYNEKQNRLFVIEVNSAPGIVGNNVEKYVEAIYDTIR